MPVVKVTLAWDAPSNMKTTALTLRIFLYLQTLVWGICFAVNGGEDRDSRLPKMLRVNDGQ